jgi:hypothetical protein
MFGLSQLSIRIKKQRSDPVFLVQYSSMRGYHGRVQAEDVQLTENRIAANQELCPAQFGIQRRDIS